MAPAPGGPVGEGGRDGRFAAACATKPGQTKPEERAIMYKRFLAVAVLCLAAAPAFGQAGGGGAGGGGGRGRGNFDPAQMRQRMEERLKTELGVSDDEWKALQPKVEKVM